MGLNALVHCDCVEAGRLLVPPPFPDLLFVAPDGCPELKTETEAQREAELDWFFAAPCRHENFELVNFYLGNISLLGYLRSAVDDIAQAHQTMFPVLRDKVIYSGIHAGDYLNLEEVESLAAEIEHLRALPWDCLQRPVTLKERIGATFYNQRARYLTDFFGRMDELIAASRRVGKPIVF